MNKRLGPQGGREVVSFMCPFCGRKVTVVDPPAVLHGDPACSRFLALEVTEYLAAVNRELPRRN